jgi:hypothetical protein
MSQSVIFGKINPILSIVEQSSLFNPTPTYITANYMAAVANNYVLGTNSVTFRIMYGNCTFDGEGNVVAFKTIHSDSATLSGSTISSWGEDDGPILEALATQQGTTVTEIIEGDISAMGMMF